MHPHNYRALFEKYANEETDLNSVLVRLRTDGASKVHSIAALCGALDWRIQDAKALVHNSAAWEDVRERDEQFHEDFERAIQATIDSENR